MSNIRQQKALLSDFIKWYMNCGRDGFDIYDFTDEVIDEYFASKSPAIPKELCSRGHIKNF